MEHPQYHDSACNKKPHNSAYKKGRTTMKELREEYLKNLPPGHIPPLTHEQYAIYRNHLRQSEGFDVPFFPGRCMVGGISPLTIYDGNREELSDYCKVALGGFNSDKTSNYGFDGLVKAMTQPTCGAYLYITFRAKDPVDDTCVIFETKVWRKIMKQGIEVKFCRIKSTQ